MKAIHINPELYEKQHKLIVLGIGILVFAMVLISGKLLNNELHPCEEKFDVIEVDNYNLVMAKAKLVLCRDRYFRMYRWML